MFFTLPFGLLIVCFALLFGLSAVGNEAEILGDGPDRSGNRRRLPRSKPKRRRRTPFRLFSRGPATRATSGPVRNPASGFTGSEVAGSEVAGSTSAADYFGYDFDGFPIDEEGFEDVARRLDEQARLHMDQIQGDGT